MWGSVLKTTVRALYRDKVYSSINVIGLAIALATCLVVGQYVFNELTYDLHHDKHERIYRVSVEVTVHGRTERSARTSAFLGPLLAENYAEVADFVRVRPMADVITGQRERFVRHDQTGVVWRDVYTVDPSIFELFTHRIVFGDTRSALAAPDSVAISRSVSQRYFGDANPVGETLIFEDGQQRVITLVFDDLPDNSHLKYDILLPYEETPLIPEDARHFWGGGGFTYLLMPEEYDSSSFARISDDMFERYMTEHAAYLNASWRAELQPLAAVHYGSDLRHDLPTGNEHFLRGLLTVAVLILFVAGANYVNLATARATNRLRESRMRRIVGASRLAISAQFVAESVLVALAALAVAFVFYAVATAILPLSEVLGYAFELTATERLFGFLLAVAFTLVVGVLAGLYPAYYLSSFVDLVDPSNSKRGGTTALRQVLVLMQLAVSVSVVACTAVMASQLAFMANQPLGYDREDRFVTPLHGADLIERIPAIENELEQSASILGVTAADRLMDGSDLLYTYFETEDTQGKTVSVFTRLMPVAEDYIETMGMELVVGRLFSKDGGPDGTVIVNEAVVRNMNWRDPLGKRMGLRNLEVIGVVRDFNFRSLHEPVEPVAIVQYRTNFERMPAAQRPFRNRYLIVHFAGERMADAVRVVEETLLRFGSTRPFEYSLLEEVLAAQYVSETHFMKLVGGLATICVIVACMGLIGLTAFSVSQRSKEIAIRKVLGASTAEIVLLLNRYLIPLMALASVLAFLLAFSAMDAWLSEFDQRIPTDPRVFVMSGIGVFCVALAAGAVQAFLAARGHPVESLRYE